MDRGLRLEEDAAHAFAKKFKKKLTTVGICAHNDYPDIFNSPDALIKHGSKFTEALEIKCLSPARHWQAIIENTVPKEFEAQVVQYFIVNPDLKKLYVAFYDPDNLHFPLHVIIVTRESLGDKIQTFFEFEVGQLKAIEELVEKYGF